MINRLSAVSVQNPCARFSWMLGRRTYLGQLRVRLAAIFCC